MADGTHIEWTDATWNPARGCSRVSPGCGGANHEGGCYAERIAARFSGPGQPFEGFARRTPHGGQWTGKLAIVESALDLPLRWRKPRRLFVNSMSDLFHENLPDAAIDRVFAVMALAPQHIFQVLTKRAERMREYLCDDNDASGRILDASVVLFHRLGIEPPAIYEGDEDGVVGWLQWPLPNVWLGVSVEDQARADERIPLLLDTPAAVRFISAEPLLGPVDLTRLCIVPQKPGSIRAGIHVDALRNKHRESGMPRGLGRLDWVITGGESGPGARPMHPDWARSLRDQCQAAGVPFFFKQWGAWAPIPHRDDLPGRPQMVGRGDLFLAVDGRTAEIDDRLGCQLEAIGTPLRHVGKRAAGRLLDGREHSEFPA